MSGVRSVRIIRGDKRYKSRNTQTGLGYSGNCPVITLLDLSWSATNQYYYTGQISSELSIGAFFSESISDGTAPASLLSDDLPTGFSLSYNGSKLVWQISVDGSQTFGEKTFTVYGTDADGCTITPRLFTVMVQYADIADYISRVQSAGSDITGSLLTANDNLITDLLSIRSNALRLNTVSADGFAGIFEPVILGPNVSTPLGGSSDINNNIVSGNYGLTTGVLGNGTTMYIQTGFIPSAISQWGLNNACFCFGKKGGTAGSRCVMGASDAGFTKKAMLFDSWGGGAPLIAMNTSSNDLFGSGQLADGNYFVVRTQNADYDVYIDGVYNTTITRAADVEPDDEFLLFEAALAGYKYNGTLTWYGLFTGMSAGNIATLNTAINNFFTAIGR